jgi:hypothetical protein
MPLMNGNDASDRNDDGPDDQTQEDKEDTGDEGAGPGPVRGAIAALVDEHPVGALAAAAGIGYALGGGLVTSLTSRLLRWGFRLGVQLAVLPVLERELADLAGSLGDSLKGDGVPPDAHR